MATKTKTKRSGKRSARGGAQRLGYARVSTAGQNLDSQRDALEAAGCTQVFEDTISGTTKERPGWDGLLGYARAGDTLVTTELSRMSRSLLHLLQVVAELEEREIGIVSLRENIDTTTATGRLFLSIMGAVSQMERELRAERAAAGRAAARARGRSGGRPRTSREKLEKARLLYESKVMNAAEAAETAGTSRRALFRYLVETRAPAEEPSPATRKKAKRAEPATKVKTKRAKPATSLTEHLHIRVQLEETKVWRRIRLPVAGTFEDLHLAIQDAFGWEDFHLYQFDGVAQHSQLGPPYASATKLAELLRQPGDGCMYRYDLGDLWEHVVRVEAAKRHRDADAWVLAGGGTTPPEDCGGPPGYYELLRIRRSKKRLPEWARGWRPNAFDRKTLPRRVRKPGEFR